MGTEQSDETAGLTADERARLRRAHERLRSASKELEVLVATEPMKNRWAPEPAPPEILDAARAELREAWAGVVRSQQEILGWDAGAHPG
ncbi:MAG: hypothetical protein QOD69_1357 [Solirubrobacteraceae bacterium]|jgi:hypothetical protein|nr:hypothetical protein [Solirubrobacteraceae bacterium]